MSATQCKILRHGLYETLYDMPLYINWPLTFMCNYNCSYCFGHDKFDKSKFVPLLKYEIAIDNICKLNRPLYDITLVGGEPTLHPDFIDIVRLIVQKIGGSLNRIRIQTNGSRSIDFFSQILPYAKQTEIVLNISLHTDHVSLKHIDNLIRRFSSDFNFIFSLMYNPLKLSRVDELCELLFDLRFKYPFETNFISLREPPDFSRLDSRYTPEMLQYQYDKQLEFENIAKYSPAVFESKLISCPHELMEMSNKGQIHKIECKDRWLEYNAGAYAFEGINCISGSHMLRIEADGGIRGLVCELVKPYANIFDPNLPDNFLKIEAIKCTMPKCGCEANDIAPKFHDSVEASNFVNLVKKKQDMLFSMSSGIVPKRIHALATRERKPRVLSTPNSKIGDLAETIMALRPDVALAFTSSGSNEVVKILEWAINYGIFENSLLARLAPEIMSELNKIR